MRALSTNQMSDKSLDHSDPLNKGDYSNRYKHQPPPRYERTHGPPSESRSVPYEPSFDHGPVGRPPPEVYYPKNGDQRPPRTYQTRQDYEPADPRNRRDDDYRSEHSRKRSNRYDDHRSPPVPYGEKPSFSGYENRQDRRRDYDRPSDTYRTRQTSREEYRDNHRNRSDLVDPRRPERSFKSPPRSDRYPSPAHRAEPRGEPLNEDIIQDSIFVSNLPLDAIVTEIASLFGSIGVIKTDKKTGIPKIKLYYHPNGNPKGEASVYYQDSQAARAAIEWFNRNIPFSHTVDSELRGNTLKVQMAERTYSASYISGRGNRGNFRGSSRGRDDRVFSRNLPPDFGEEELSRGRPKPAFIQPGDWACSQCNNNNFAWRTACNRCQAPKTEPQSDQFQRSPQRGPPTFQAPSSGYRYT